MHLTFAFLRRFILIAQASCQSPVWAGSSSAVCQYQDSHYISLMQGLRCPVGIWLPLLCPLLLRVRFLSPIGERNDEEEM